MRYSNEKASSLSSTAHAVPLLPHGRRLFAPLALVGWVVLLGARVWGTLMSQRVLYPLPLSRSPSFHMEGGIFAPLALVVWVVHIWARVRGVL